ncbi:MAG: hypothetical protein QW331_02690 [Candidatus Woesearchaeota archaeon]
MRKIIFALMFIFLVPFVLAEDIVVDVNGGSIDKPIIVEPGAEFEIGITREPGVLIQNVKVESNSAFVKSIANRYELAPSERAMERKRISKMQKLDEFLPSGTYTLSLIFDYDKDDEQKQEIKMINLEIQSGGAGSDVLGWIVRKMPEDVAREILNYYYPVKLERLNPELTDEEMREIGAKGVKQEIVSEQVTHESAPKKHVDENKPAQKIQKSLRVYRVNTIGKEKYVTKVVLSVAGNGLSDLELVEDIPKQYLSNANRAVYSRNPIIIQKDPVIKWEFDYVPPGETKDYSYIVEAKMEEPPENTVAVANNPTMLALFTRFVLNGGWIVLFILLIVLAGVLIWWIRKRRKGRKEKINPFKEKKR